jgi:hypothetical protein
MDAVRIIDVYIAKCFDLVQQLVLHHTVTTDDGIALLDQYITHEHVKFGGVFVNKPEFIRFDDMDYPGGIGSRQYN